MEPAADEVASTEASDSEVRQHLAAAPAHVEDVDEAVKKLGPYMRPPVYQRILLGMLQATDEVFSEAGIPYWICGGVLIGAMRHGGFVPHDDDLDIECFESDVPRIKDAFAASSLPVCFEVCSRQRSGAFGKLVFFDIKTIQTTIDVFLREESLEKLPEFPSAAEVFPLRRYDFNGVLVSGPGGDPRAYLARCYSPEVFDVVKVWNHHVDYLGDVDTAVFDASSWSLPLPVYLDAVSRLGYRPPAVEVTAAETFAHLGREGGEVQTMLWETLGWASPMLPPPDAVCFDDAG